jgi:hypothetical protein
MRRLLNAVLPVFGAVGFAVFSELSLSRSDQFFWWSLATMAWILGVFALLARKKLRGRLTPIAIPAVAMIALSTVMSLLFLDLIANRHAFIAVFAVVLYLFLEHVRRETLTDDPEERLSISEFARMVNIGSLFLIASVGLGTTAFLPIQRWWTLPFVVLVSALWSWHLFFACAQPRVRPFSRMGLTMLIVLETYLVALSLPTQMFVGGAMVGIIYYLAANLLPLGAVENVSSRLIRKYAFYAGGLLMLMLVTARWV